jgi:thiaminase (transcriptional activator TenA)
LLHDTLWAANFDLARSCLAHPFVRLLGEGTLDVDLFRAYIAQDAFFLRAFVRAYAVVLAKSEETESASVFHLLIGGAIAELEVHRRYAAELGIDLEHVAPNRACSAYTDFLLHTAWHCQPGETVAAMTPCMRLYAYLGGELARSSHRNHAFRQWIESYSGDEFARLAARLEALLDRLAADTRQVRDTYRYAMQCELDFFSQFVDMGLESTNEP